MGVCLFFVVLLVLLNIQPARAEPCYLLGKGQVSELREKWLRPTQAVIGMMEGRRKREQLESHDKKWVRERFEESPLKVVIGPDGLCYVVDGHHRWWAGSTSGQKGLEKYTVEVVHDSRPSGSSPLESHRRFKKMTKLRQQRVMRGFWLELVRRKQVWLHDGRGEILPWVDERGQEVLPLKGRNLERFEADLASSGSSAKWKRAFSLLSRSVKRLKLVRPAIPTNIIGVRNDPYRDLAKFIRQAGGYQKAEGSEKVFQEFYWDIELRKRIRLHAGSISVETWRDAMEKALKFAHSREASHLPGSFWAGGAAEKGLPPSERLSCIIDAVLEKHGDD